MSIPRFNRSMFELAAERYGETYAGSPSVSLSQFVRDGTNLSTNSYSGIAPSTTAGWPISISNYFGLTSPRVWTTQSNNLYPNCAGNKTMLENSRWYAHQFSGYSDSTGYGPLGVGNPSSAAVPEKYVNNVWSTSQNPSVNRNRASAGGLYNNSISVAGANYNTIYQTTELYNGTAWSTTGNIPMSHYGGIGSGPVNGFVSGSGNASMTINTGTGNSYYMYNTGTGSWTTLTNGLNSSAQIASAAWGSAVDLDGLCLAAKDPANQYTNATYRYDHSVQIWNTEGSQLYSSLATLGTSYHMMNAGGGGMAGIVLTPSNGSSGAPYLTQFTSGGARGSRGLTSPTTVKHAGTLGTAYNNNRIAIHSHGGTPSGIGSLFNYATFQMTVPSSASNQLWAAA